MYFFCVFVCVFFGFILTATATVYITMCILKNGFNFMRRLRVPVPAVCNAWPVKNTDIDVIFSYLARCVLNVHLVLSVDLFFIFIFFFPIGIVLESCELCSHSSVICFVCTSYCCLWKVVSLL